MAPPASRTSFLINFELLITTFSLFVYKQDPDLPVLLKNSQF